MTLPTLQEVRYAQAKKSLKHFVTQAWQILEPATPLLWNWHLDLLCEHLESVSRGECHQLAVNIPPRYMKSMLVTIMWPCWEWATNPGLRYLFVSYAAKLSVEHSVKRRLILESPWYATGMHGYWGHKDYSLTDDQNTKTGYANTYRGQMDATSVGASAIGQGGDRVVIDDPVNPQEALSDTQRATANDFFDAHLSSRLNTKQGEHEGAFVLVMQRLHMDDLTGHVLKEGGWEHVCIPAIAEKDEDVVFPSGHTVHRCAESLLWPEREGQEQINKARLRLNSYGFAGQYQQRPVPLEGGLIKRTYLRFWVSEWLPGDERGVNAPGDIMQLPAGDLTDFCQSWDTTYWETSTADYCVGQVWAKMKALRFLLHQDRARRDLPSTKAAIRAMSTEWPEALRKYVERTANGSEVLRTMMLEIPGLVGVDVKGSKEARLHAELGQFEAFQVVIPHPREAAWVGEYMLELTTYPSAEHDDQVDCTSQALKKMREGGTAPTAGQRQYTKPQSMAPQSNSFMHAPSDAQRVQTNSGFRRPGM